jgi:ABC-2 type transport system ATP-binding protein
VIIIHEGKIVAVDTPENLTERLQKSSKTLIHIEGVRQEIADQLSALSCALRVIERGEVSPGVFSFEVETEKDREISGELSYLVYRNKWKLVEMRAERMSLEDIFIELVTQEEEV